MNPRAHLISAIAFALTKVRRQLRVIVCAHTSDAERQQAAETIVEHLELCGFEFRQKPPPAGHKTPGA
ncbi:MAG: hypothetical protein U1E45_16440 [Geminicoccaceae bacterium]